MYDGIVAKGGCVFACLIITCRVEKGSGARNGVRAYLYEGILLPIGVYSRVFIRILCVMWRRKAFFLEASDLADGGRAVCLERPA